MDLLTTLETIEYSERIAVIDPHGIIISLVSISIVFISLIVLYIAYELIGILVNRWFVKKKDGCFVVEDSLNSSGNDVHDMESYVLTFNRKATQTQKTIDRGTRILSHSTADEDSTTLQSRIPASFDGFVRSPLPGTILKIAVKEGDKVEIGQAVAILEAMKMENTIEAERNGTVTKIHVTQGDSVLEGSEILTIE